MLDSYEAIGELIEAEQMDKADVETVIEDLQSIKKPSTFIGKELRLWQRHLARMIEESKECHYAYIA